MDMQTEFEAKFYPLGYSKEEFRAILEDVGAKMKTPERKMRRLIFHKRHNPTLQCHYIRVRDEGDSITLSAKTHAKADGDIGDQKEAVVCVQDYEETVTILEQAGLVPGSFHLNFRETWELEGALVEIDSWPGIDTYVEIEADSEEKVREVAERLGFDWKKKHITSCVEFYKEKYDISDFEEVMAKMTELGKEFE